MKIIKVSEDTYFSVKTDDPVWPYYRRNGPESWENLMGESWEPVYFQEEELEKAFNEFIS